MNQIERMQKELCRKGLAQVWDELIEQTDYVRGLILTEAKNDCDNNSSLSWEKYLEAFTVDGKSVTPSYASSLARTMAEKVELNKTLSSLTTSYYKKLKTTKK